MDRDEREAKLTSLPCRMSFLMLAGMRCLGKMVGLTSGIPVGGNASVGAVAVPGVVTTGCSCRAPTHAWMPQSAMVNAPAMLCSWARAEKIDCRDAC